MRYRPTLTPAERTVIRRWTGRILAMWIVVVAATLSLSLFATDRSDPAPAHARVVTAK